MPKTKTRPDAPPTGEMETRFARFSPATYDAEARTVEAVLSTGAAVKRWWMVEELEISNEAIDLDRVDKGQVKLLDHHNQFERKAVLGTIDNVRIENGALIGELRFGDTDEARDAAAMVERGELTGISIGYQVSSWERVAIEDDTETWRATRWTLMEASLVSVPADMDAKVRSAPRQIEERTDDMLKKTEATGATPDKQTETPNPETRGASAPSEPAPPAPVTATRTEATAAEIADIATRAGLDMQFVADMSGKTLDEVRAAALDKLSSRTEPTITGTHHDETLDNPEFRRSVMSDALCARATGEKPEHEAAQQFANFGFVDLAAECLGMRASPRGFQRVQTIQRALTTGDFPLILEDAANKMMLTEYTRATPTYRSIMKRRDLADFKTAKMYRLGDFPTLEPVVERGEIEAGGLGEAKETATLETFGRRVSITRQMLINDDMGAFAEIGARAALAVALFENTKAYTVLLSNSGVGPKLSDTKAVFHTDHANLAGSGGAINVTTVSAGRAAMRKQTSFDKNQKLNLSPNILLCGPDKETEAEAFVSEINPSATSEVNVFSGKLQVVADAEITGNPWWLFASPMRAEVFIYGYLAQNPGPIFMTDRVSPVDGMELAVVLDFYVSATDYRGGYKNPGA